MGSPFDFLEKLPYSSGTVGFVSRFKLSADYVQSPRHSGKDIAIASSQGGLQFFRKLNHSLFNNVLSKIGFALLRSRFVNYFTCINII